ncbi:peptide ABC transporter [Deinococcus psychrotolerans]|uniref:Peptide ABC transporter n=1 Tax=Deinococcus psychrotolerans TaxID=2489213 RepID=A0A3G8YC88_9DEIO|nr:M55 family metallopeptidase [Deinococcus psychrotolerans]AZI42999.1 peptide ABC transporter [Deinococcus psychrotolerans]
MNVVISVDMEGVCGVSSWVQVSPPEFGGLVSGSEYERARIQMSREANAAALGAFEGGASGVLIADSHDTMRNLLPEYLDERVRYVSGNDRALSMVQGVQEKGVGALMMVGYHARAGTQGAPLAHTWNGSVRDVRINGVQAGEPYLNALLAGHYGVPTVFISGDDVAVKQVQESVGTEVVGVAVKEGLSMFSAVHLHPAEACRQIRAGAKKAAEGMHSAQPFTVLFPASVQLSFDHQARADQAGRVPGVTRIDAVTVGYSSPDAFHLFQMFRMLCKVAEVQLNG